MKTSISIKFYDDFLDTDAVLHAKHSLWVSLTRISDIDNYYCSSKLFLWIPE